LTEEKGAFLTLFLPPDTDLPSKWRLPEADECHGWRDGAGRNG